GSASATAAVALMLHVHRLAGTFSSAITMYIALTQFARRKFIDAGLPSRRIAVKPNFVYPDPGVGSEDREYALFVGRLSPEKGVSTLLAAWSRLGEPIPLLVVGDGPLLSALQAEAARLGLSQVRFAGRLTRNQGLAAMKRARVLLFPSLWYEGFPMVIAEAFACSTPVICSSMGAMAEIV